MKLAGIALRAPTTVKTTLPEAARALEQTWQRRRQELAGWQPSNGWLMETPQRGDNDQRMSDRRNSDRRRARNSR